MAGFFNPIVDCRATAWSGPCRCWPNYKGQYYESLSLAMFRMLVGSPVVEPGFRRDRFIGRNYHGPGTTCA
jgi:adenylate cyclase